MTSEPIAVVEQPATEHTSVELFHAVPSTVTADEDGTFVTFSAKLQRDPINLADASSIRSACARHSRSFTASSAAMRDTSPRTAPPT